MLLSALALVYLTFSKGFSFAEELQNTKILILWLVCFAFIAEYVDSSLGMGYGTVLTPILLILGFKAIHVVPAILFSEFITGMSAGFFHHKLGNVNLGRKTEARGIVKIIVIFSIAGTALAVFLMINLPKFIVKIYIAVMLLSIGLFIMVGKKILGEYSRRKIMGLGAIAAFNKGISGGGYGPLVTGGQVILGVPEKEAVGITSLAEGIVCITGLILYAVTNGLPDWGIALPLAIGGIMSVPISAWTVKVLPASLLRRYIGYATIFLGLLTLAKILL
jgi:hypothetical protein